MNSFRHKFYGFLLRGPYSNSSANSTHLYSRILAFFSTRRYKGMLIFHGRENTFGSSIVASYMSVSALRGVQRSTTCKASLRKLPARSNQVWSFRLVTSTTSVSPSQRPLDHPIQLSAGAFVGGPILMMRTAPAYS